MAEKLCLRVNDFQDNIIQDNKTGSNAQAQPKTSIMSADLQEMSFLAILGVPKMALGVPESKF